MTPSGPAFGWVDNATPYITAAHLEAMYQGPYRCNVDTPEAHGAARDNSTDDTAAIQAAINAVVTNGISDGSYYGEVWFTAGIYKVSSATTKGGSTTKGNAQITLPIVDTSGQKFTLVLRGLRDATAMPHWNQTTAQYAGVVIRSTLTSQSVDGTWGNPSILGGPTEWTDPNGSGSGSFMNMNLVVDGITFAAPFGSTGPTLGGVDGGQLANLNVYSVNFQTDKYPTQLSGGSYATNTQGVALKMPNLNNNDNCNIYSMTAYGWGIALAAADHLVCTRLAAIYCGVAVYISHNAASGNSHGARLNYMSVEGGGSIVQAETTSGAKFPLTIGQVDVEVQNANDFIDSDNILYGTVAYQNNSGSSASKTGATNLTVTNLL